MDLSSIVTTTTTLQPQWLLYLFLLLPLLLLWSLLSTKPKTLNLPPSPPSLPIIGHMHLLTSLPHHSLRRLALQLNAPLLHLRLGHIPTLVASTAATAEQILKTHDTSFCTRPDLVSSRMLSYGFRNIALSPYSDEWRQLRKLVNIELFNNKRVLSFANVREEEVNSLVESVSAKCREGEEVDLSAALVGIFNDVICKVVLGRRTSGDQAGGERNVFHGLVLEAMRLLAGFFVEDFFPTWGLWCRVFGIGRSEKKRLEKNFREMDKFFEGEIEKNSVEGRRPANLLQVLINLQSDASLGFEFTRGHVKAILLDLFLGGTDTSSVTLEWAMSELIRSPTKLRKATDEIRALCGHKPRVQESDLQHLPYLKQVIKETLRLHPPAVLLLPRVCQSACNVDGYDVAVGTRVMVNAWAIGRDPEQWDKPEEFQPERFEKEGREFKGQDFGLIPFGSGRRICPGIGMATVNVELALANLLFGFDWEASGEVDMSEEFGLSVHRKVPLVLKPKLKNN